jgi:hypothetical protein
MASASRPRRRRRSPDRPRAGGLGGADLRLDAGERQSRDVDVQDAGGPGLVSALSDPVELRREPLRVVGDPNPFDGIPRSQERRGDVAQRTPRGVLGRRGRALDVRAGRVDPGTALAAQIEHLADPNVHVRAGPARTDARPSAHLEGGVVAEQHLGVHEAAARLADARLRNPNGRRPGPRQRERLLQCQIIGSRSCRILRRRGPSRDEHACEQETARAPSSHANISLVAGRGCAPGIPRPRKCRSLPELLAWVQTREGSGGLKMRPGTAVAGLSGGAFRTEPSGGDSGHGTRLGATATTAPGQQVQSSQPGGHCSSDPSSGHVSSPWSSCASSPASATSSQGHVRLQHASALPVEAASRPGPMPSCPKTKLASRTHAANQGRPGVLWSRRIMPLLEYPPRADRSTRQSGVSEEADSLRWPGALVRRADFDPLARRWRRVLEGGSSGLQGRQ